MAHALARELRNNSTPAERRLWRELRLLKTEGRHFRRQVPIGPYVADVACHSVKLVIEVDGGQHSAAADKDIRRSREIEKHGYRTIRFWNSEIAEALEGVVDRIRQAAVLPTAFTYHACHAAQTTPTPALPTRGREKME